MSEDAPRIAVLSLLFPHPGQPNAGLFIRERMFRVGRRLPLLVVSPVPWFPLQGIVRRWRPQFRPPAPRRQSQEGYEVYHPRFLSVPGVLKSLDGLLLALGTLPLMMRLHREGRVDLIDAHFAYPDGYAASLLGRWLGVPFTITLRGTEVPHSRDPRRRRLMLKAVARSSRVFSVSESLRCHLGNLGADTENIQVVGNGVDISRFEPVPREEARRRLGLPLDAKVLITVGALVERKGFHRVLDVMPSLGARFPGLVYLLVGGPGPEGDWGERLREQASDLGLGETARFLGPVPPEELKVPLSAADVFVLASRNEGWANVLLEAMACGVPVVASEVGGNGEVICRPELGRLVPFGDQPALAAALSEALEGDWDHDAIVAHARENQWDRRVEVLGAALRQVSRASQPAGVKRDRGLGSLGRRIEREWLLARKRVRSLTRACPATGERVFVAGMQRSGTNMLMDVLERSFETDVYHERDPRAFDNYLMRERAVIHTLVRRSRAECFVIKALCELQDLSSLMDEFAPAKTVWLVRRFDDVVNSMVASFGNMARQLRRIVRDRGDPFWLGRGMSESTRSELERLVHPELDDFSASALQWYLRNVLYFEQGFHRDPRVLLVGYERLVHDPRVEVSRMFEFLGLEFAPRCIRRITPRSVRRRPSPAIEVPVREVCERLFARFELQLSTPREAAA